MAQWGFVGPAYQAANVLQDNQASINWFVEIDPNEPNPQGPTMNAAEAKTALGLLGVPGLSSINSAFNGPVRGAWVLPGNTQCIFVIGASVVVATASHSGTQATYSFSSVGTMQSASGTVDIRDNGAGKIAVIVDGSTNLYVYDVTAGTLTRFAGTGYLGATNVVELDGWFVFNQPGTQKFFTSPNYWNGTDNFDGTFFALKDDSPDNLVTLYQNHREIWMIGESTTEPWYNQGGANFPLGRIDGAMIQIGCAAAHSVARTGKGMIWLGRSERGENSVVITEGYDFKVVSTPAVSWALNQYPVVSDAIGYTYTEEGHEFYVLTLPTADATWVYDLTTGFWHQRASFDTATGQFHRQRVNCLVNFAGNRIGGDYNNGRIYRQSRDYFADDQYPLVAMRRSPHVWDKNDRNRVAHSRLQIEFFPGVGLSTGQGSDPQAMLRWSNDGGRTWGNEHWTGIGKTGETKNRAIWRRLGAARDRVYEVRVSDPVKRDIVGASLAAGATGS
jgi:hypothetical protein